MFWWLLALVVALMGIIILWMVWQALAIQAKFGDDFYRRFTRKLLSKEYREG